MIALIRYILKLINSIHIYLTKNESTEKNIQEEKLPYHFTKELIYENKNKLKDAKKINIIHFNDVYNVESSKIEPVAGAARFATAVEKLREQGPTLLVFSGDAISPSNSNIQKNKL